jgi:hypothetical protein
MHTPIPWIGLAAIVAMFLRAGGAPDRGGADRAAAGPRPAHPHRPARLARTAVMSEDA